MKDFENIIQVLKNGNHLGCWASGGRVPIVAIINPKGETIVSGEGGIIRESFEMAENNCAKYIKGEFLERKNLMTGAIISELNPKDIFTVLHRWVQSDSGYLEVRWNSYSNIFIAMLDGYNDNFKSVIQLAFNKDLMKAIELGFAAPKILK